MNGQINQVQLKEKEILYIYMLLALYRNSKCKSVVMVSVMIKGEILIHCLFAFSDFFWFFKTGFLFSIDYPGTPSVDRVDLGLIEIHLPLLPECWHINDFCKGLATLGLIIPYNI